MPKQISKEIKHQVLARVREGKETVVTIAQQHGLKINTVYNWISRGLETGNPLLELARLKRENTRLKQIIGGLVLDQERKKKD
jgi:transposase-like protein